jgi:hypothetical protein
VLPASPAFVWVAEVVDASSVLCLRRRRRLTGFVVAAVSAGVAGLTAKLTAGSCVGGAVETGVLDTVASGAEVWTATDLTIGAIKGRTAPEIFFVRPRYGPSQK